MDFRVLVRKQGAAFEAWAPELHECRAIGGSEEEALQNLRERILAEFSPETQGAPPHVQERTISVDIPEGATVPTKAQAERDSTEGMVRAQFSFGIALALLGITGILFSAMSSQTAQAPFLLFAPIVVTAFGVLGIIMGIAGKSSLGRRF